MKLHSSLTAYLGGILMLLTSAVFISHLYDRIGIILCIFFTFIISVFLYFTNRLVAQRTNNIFVQIGIFIFVGSILRILSNIGNTEIFEYYLSSFFSLNALIWSAILISPSFVLFQILKSLHFITITNDLCEFENFWGESGHLELKNVRILEHKIVPFFLPVLIPAFLFGIFRVASITWEDDDF